MTHSSTSKPFDKTGGSFYKQEKNEKQPKIVAWRQSTDSKHSPNDFPVSIDLQQHLTDEILQANFIPRGFSDYD